MSRIEEIKARRAAISPLPWEWDGDKGNLLAGPAMTQEQVWDRNFGSYETEYVSRAGGGIETPLRLREAIIQTDSGAYPPRGANREFIAHAPEDIDFLLARIAELEAAALDMRTACGFVLQSQIPFPLNKAINKMCAVLGDDAKPPEGTFAARVEKFIDGIGKKTCACGEPMVRGLTFWTLMGYMPRADGHYHDRNRGTGGWKCSNGHHEETTHYRPCPIAGCEWKPDWAESRGATPEK